MSMAVAECPPAGAQTELEPQQQRCSEAMRRGSRYHEQAYGVFYDQNQHTTCALGALLVGLIGAQVVEVRRFDTVRALVAQHTGVDLRRMVFCPVTEHSEHLDTAIMTLNDNAHWTREQIADWLEAQGF